MAAASEFDDPVQLAQELMQKWDEGRGIPKSELERIYWDDGSSHGRRFDRFIKTHLGIVTAKRSALSIRVDELEQQVRSLQVVPMGAQPLGEWEPQLQQARHSCLAALRIWNDPTATFRTESFALLFVAAWNSLAIALLQSRGENWKAATHQGKESDRSLSTPRLIVLAFSGPGYRGLRANVEEWILLRNKVAHQHLPVPEASLVPLAQVGLTNFERALEDGFGSEYSLGADIAAPLYLEGPIT